MKTSFFIARRYFLNRKNRSFINAVAIISLLGTGIGTFALVVSLSFFNGLEHLVVQLYDTFDPDIKIEAKKGKYFAEDSINLAGIRQVAEVEYISPVIEDNALVTFGDNQLVCTIKGIDTNYANHFDIDKSVVYGKFLLKKKMINTAVLGSGIYADLGINMSNTHFSMDVMYPKLQKRLMLNPATAFTTKKLIPAGVFAIEKQFDEKYILTNLDFIRELTQRPKEITSIDVKLTSKAQSQMAKKNIEKIIGEAYNVKTANQMHESLVRVLKIEKIFVFLTLGFIIVIAAFNIFFCLSMLVIQKRPDLSLLKVLGANETFIKRIFLFEGALVGLGGGLLGLLLGLGFVWVQGTYGLIELGIEAAVVSAYPVKIIWFDVLAAFVFLVVITWASAIVPTIRAARIGHFTA